MKRTRGVARQRMAGTGNPRCPQHVLHSRLVPEVSRRLDAQPRNPECLPYLGERNLQLLQRAQQSFGSSDPSLQPLHRFADLHRVEAVLDLTVARQRRAQVVGNTFGAVLCDQPASHAFQPCRRPHEAQRRRRQKRRHENHAASSRWHDDPLC